MKTKSNQLQMMSSINDVLEKADKKQAWRPFIHLIKSVKLPWILIVICTVIQLTQSYLTLLFPKYTEKIYAGEFSTYLAVTAVLVVLGKALLIAVYQFIAKYTSHMNHMSFQNYIWKRLSRLPLPFYFEIEPRDLISRTTTDTLTLSEFLSYGIANIFSTIVTFGGSFLLILQYDWRLAVSQAVSLPLCYVVNLIAGRIFFKFNKRIQGKLSDMTRYFSAILPYITLVKLFGQENREEKNGNEWIEKYAKINFEYTLASSAVSFANTLTTVLQELIVIMMGVWLVRKGELDIGVWIAFYMYANTLSISFRSVMSLWQTVKRNQGACMRISEVTGVPAEENPGELDASTAKGDIAFKNITFAYQEKEILKSVDFTVEEGKVTAIVGPSGAGKTTILSLMERFYNPKEGEIHWGNHPATDFDLYSWRRAIGYIPQDTRLLSGTIRDNIIYGMEEKVSEEKIIEAAKLADAYDFIMRMDKGFDTQVGENGAKLSGGQRQRIAIARAIVKEAKLLVLDEVTSNLDAESEHRINHTLKKLSKTHTVLIVAHNMDSIKDADKIIVLDKSHINGQGTHEDLINNNELYRHLVELQTIEAVV